MTTEEYKEKLKLHPVVHLLSTIVEDRPGEPVAQRLGLVAQIRGDGGRNSISNSIRLVGGSIIDILEDRTPKDYDIIHGQGAIPRFEEHGFTFVSDTEIAVTFKRNDITIQFLKTYEEDFDFTISRAAFYLREDRLNIDMQSFVNKILIPISYKKHTAINSLRRIPHWNKKGYNIADVTYYGLLSAIEKPGHVSGRQPGEWGTLQS